MKIFLVFTVLGLSLFSQLSSGNISTQEIKSINLLTGQAEVLKIGATKKGLVLVFLSAKCPCSNSHLQELKSLFAEFSDFTFVAVHSNSDESIESAKTYFSAAHLPFLVLQDHKTEIADQFKANKTPHAFVVAPNGDTLYQGGVTNSVDATRATKHYLKEALVDLKEGKSVQVTEGRTLGCVISREGQNVW